MSVDEVFLCIAGDAKRREYAAILRRPEEDEDGNIQKNVVRAIHVPDEKRSFGALFSMEDEAKNPIVVCWRAWEWRGVYAAASKNENRDGFVKSLSRRLWIDPQQVLWPFVREGSFGPRYEDACRFFGVTPGNDAAGKAASLMELYDLSMFRLSAVASAENRIRESGGIVDGVFRSGLFNSLFGS